MRYEIPHERYFRIHHIRPRFKNNVESVLLFLANEISSLKASSKENFKENINKSIRLYPGNYTRKQKTIDNWRTEISALFGFIQYRQDQYQASKMAILLSENQDLIEFFRYFLFYFQYPGGHLKPREIQSQIIKGIKFHPVRYILKLLIIGTEKNKSGKFGITKAEATHCIFNDLEVTRDNRNVQKTIELIESNRESSLTYDQSGDVTRYAGDILDYMELADLVTLKPNYTYYPNMHNIEVFESFLQKGTTFPEYEKLYTKNTLTLEDIKNTQSQWYDYINERLDEDLFSANFITLVENDNSDSSNQTPFIQDLIHKILDDQKNKSAKTKEIGDVGESIILQHEKNRMKNLSRSDLVHLIQKIPEQYAVGYDIKSFLGVCDDFSHIHIEVKTTISKGRINIQSFHMTPNEWSAASTYQDLYFIYRLLLSSQGIRLFVIRNPVRAYKDDLLDMTPRNGVSIKYNERSGEWKELLA